MIDYKLVNAVFVSLSPNLLYIEFSTSINLIGEDGVNTSKLSTTVYDKLIPETATIKLLNLVIKDDV